MNSLRLYVAALTEDECRAIYADHSEWEKTGVIGDCALRHHAKAWRIAAGIDEHNVTMWMDKLAQEVWRRFASEVLERQP
jgi:hypothetical protein